MASAKPTNQPAFRRALGYLRDHESTRAALRSAPVLAVGSLKGRAEAQVVHIASQKKAGVPSRKDAVSSTASTSSLTGTASTSSHSTSASSSLACFTDHSGSPRGEARAERNSTAAEVEVQGGIRPALLRGGTVGVSSSLKALLTTSSPTYPSSRSSLSGLYHGRSPRSSRQSLPARCGTSPPRSSRQSLPARYGTSRVALQSQELRGSQWVEVESRWQAELCMEKKTKDKSCIVRKIPIVSSSTDAPTGEPEPELPSDATQLRSISSFKWQPMASDPVMPESPRSATATDTMERSPRSPRPKNAFTRISAVPEKDSKKLLTGLPVMERSPRAKEVRTRSCKDVPQNQASICNDVELVGTTQLEGVPESVECEAVSVWLSPYEGPAEMDGTAC